MKALGAGDQLADEAEHDERPELEWDDARGEALYRDRFEAFYRERFGPMVKLAVLLTGSQEVGRDVVQDAFVRVHRRFGVDRADDSHLPTRVEGFASDGSRVFDSTTDPRLQKLIDDAG